MDIVETLILIITTPIVLILWAILVKPDNAIGVMARKFNLVWLLIGSVGVIAALSYAWFIYRHGPDGGWWPVLACIYSSAWVVVVVIIGLLLRQYRFKSK